MHFSPSSQKKTLAQKHVSIKPDTEQQPKPACMVSPYRVKLHSKTPSQFPADLLTLDKKLGEGRTQLKHMRRGRRLFGLIELEKQQKVCLSL